MPQAADERDEREELAQSVAASSSLPTRVSAPSIAQIAVIGVAVECDGDAAGREGERNGRKERACEGLEIGKRYIGK